eukprot:m51a1_g5023 putative translocon-associated protein subunit alpha (295) ;mRNA; r:336891-338089
MQPHTRLLRALALVALVALAAAAAEEQQEQQQQEMPTITVPPEQSKEIELQLLVEKMRAQMPPEQSKAVSDDQIKQFILNELRKKEAGARPSASPYSHPDALVNYQWTDPARSFLAGKPASLAISLSNNANVPFLVRGVTATLYHPADIRVQILNFTALPLGAVLEPGRDLSATYTVGLDAQMAGQVYGLMVVLHYTDGQTNFTHPVFNNTIDVADTEAAFDLQSALSLLMTCGLVGGAAWYGLGLVKGSKGPKKAQAARRTPSTSAAGRRDGSEWLEGTSAAARVRTPQQKQQ